MTHLEFAELESRAADATPFEKWCDEVESLLGLDLDGDEATDGFSIDGAHDAYTARRSATAYAASVLLAQKRLAAD